MEKLVDIHLKVEKDKNSLLACLQFTNDSNNDIYLDKQTICIDNKTRRSVFKIIDEQNNKVDYIGVLVNRDVVPADYIVLKGGERIETKVVLNEVYELPTDHKYKVQYSVFHPTYMDEEGFSKLESNTVEVLY